MAADKSWAPVEAPQPTTGPANAAQEEPETELNEKEESVCAKEEFWQNFDNSTTEEPAWREQGAAGTAVQRSETLPTQHPRWRKS